MLGRTEIGFLNKVLKKTARVSQLRNESIRFRKYILEVLNTLRMMNYFVNPMEYSRKVNINNY